MHILTGAKPKLIAVKLADLTMELLWIDTAVETTANSRRREFGVSSQKQSLKHYFSKVYP